MRNVKTASGRTGITVGLRKTGEVLVLWNDADEMDWFSADEISAILVPSVSLAA